MTKRRARQVGGAVAIIGILITFGMGFANLLWMLLVRPTLWDLGAFAIASAVLVLIGALPGIVVYMLIAPRNDQQTKP